MHMNMLLLYAKINDLPYIFYMVFVIDSLGLPDLICIHQIRKAFAVYQNHFHGGGGARSCGIHSDISPIRRNDGREFRRRRQRPHGHSQFGESAVAQRRHRQ
jgi:hypothetical protein